jgi:hypothetical protein
MAKMSGRDTPIETELKLTVPNGADSPLSNQAFFSHSATSSKSRRLVTTYFDTSSQELRRIWVRPDGRRWIQTLKSSGDSEAPCPGESGNGPLGNDEPSFTLIGETPLAGRFPAGV